jgi:hypothetical protein
MPRKPKLVKVSRELLEELLDYNEADERRHYEEELSEEDLAAHEGDYEDKVDGAVKDGACGDHIYLVICKLREQLK